MTYSFDNVVTLDNINSFKTKIATTDFGVFSNIFTIKFYN